MDQEKIGRFIAELRKENSLTQKELAEKLRKAESQFKRLFESAAKVRPG